MLGELNNDQSTNKKVHSTLNFENEKCYFKIHFDKANVKTLNQG